MSFSVARSSNRAAVFAFEDARMNRSLLRFAVVLGLLSAIGPFAIDMYLPALPSIGADLGAQNSQRCR